MRKNLFIRSLTKQELYTHTYKAIHRTEIAKPMHLEYLDALIDQGVSFRGFDLCRITVYIYLCSTVDNIQF